MRETSFVRSTVEKVSLRQSLPSQFSPLPPSQLHYSVSVTRTQNLLLSICSKDASLQVDQMKEKKNTELVEGEKQRLASVTSSESLASSGFQEDKSLSDVEEDDEGRY